MNTHLHHHVQQRPGRPVRARRGHGLPALVAAALCVALPAAALSDPPPDWVITASTVAGGSGQSADANYLVRGTGGQFDAGVPMIFGDYSLTGGFWHGGLRPPCKPDYDQNGLLDTDDISDFITDYFFTLTVTLDFPGGAPLPGPSPYAIPCPGAPDAPPPLAPDTFRLAGFKVDYNQDCVVNADDISDYITDYFAGCVGYGP